MQIKFNIRKWLSFSCIAMVAIFSPPAFSCTVSTNGINFGSINPLESTAHQATGTVTVTCPTSTSFTVALSSGAGTYTQRKMLSGAHGLLYNLYLDSSLTLIWGDGSSGTSVWSGTAGSVGVSHTVYGVVPYQSQAYAGTYTDSITITVTY